MNEEDDLHSLYDRPGFMIRRAHQIAQTLFLEECASFGVTPTQYGVMRILATRRGLDQNAVARLLKQDRSTTALVIGKLVDDGVVERARDPKDARRRTLALSAKGVALITKLEAPVRRAHERLLSAFNREDRQTFLRLLHVFIAAFSEADAPTRR